MNVADLSQSVQTLQQEVYRLMRQVMALQHPQGRVFVATRDSDAGAFTEQIPLDDASDLQDLTDGRTTEDSDTASTLIRLPSGTVPVLQYPNGDKPAFVDLSPLGLFPVNVAVHAGANGTQTTKATWTYNVTDLDGNSIGTVGMSPIWARENGYKDSATHGTGYNDSGGAFVLYQIDEVDSTSGCGL